jgi:cell wall-associated NlpC family hydrolase
MKHVLLWLGLTAAIHAATPASPVQIACELGESGLPYRWGATNPQQGGLDCSGFVLYVYQQAYGLHLPDEAGLQYEYLRRYGKVWDASTGAWSPQDLQPGDLIFYSGTHPLPRPSPITHVMMYVGNGRKVGAQTGGHRLDHGVGGVGFYPFTPSPPLGDPRQEQPEFRTSPHLYAYGRVLAPAKPPTITATITLP